jgi:hypothetical protein
LPFGTFIKTTTVFDLQRGRILYEYLKKYFPTAKFILKFYSKSPGFEVERFLWEYLKDYLKSVERIDTQLLELADILRCSADQLLSEHTLLRHYLNSNVYTTREERYFIIKTGIKILMCDINLLGFPCKINTCFYPSHFPRRKFSHTLARRRAYSSQ